MSFTFTVSNYLSNKKGATSLLVSNLLNYFIYHLEELEKFLVDVVEKNKDCPPMFKYGELAQYLFDKHLICSATGKPLKDDVVRNLVILARKEKASNLDTDMLLANLSFRLYHQDDMEDKYVFTKYGSAEEFDDLLKRKLRG